LKEFNTAKELIDRDMYDYYRKNRKKVAKEIDQYKLWVKAVNGILCCLKELVRESENGVYIEGFGYIFAEDNIRYRHRISILKKEEKIRHKIRFIPDNRRIKKRYKFTVGRVVHILNLKLKYENKLDAILYKINLNRTKWKQ
jgi:hypothetical protein